MLYRYTDNDLDLLGRILRAEAVGEGELGMLMVGNVVNNRLISTCLDFENLRTLDDVIYQTNAFSSINSPLFVFRATAKEKELAEDALRGRKEWPASNALWFYAPSGDQPCDATRFNQQLAGKFKNHCFYRPDPGVCYELQ